MINVYCESRGWLFDDLKREIAEHGAVASDEPLPQADAWICIRTSEARKSPDLSRTVVQVHDLNSAPKDDCGIVSLVHQDQVQRLKKFGYHGAVDVLPIGSRDVPIGQLPERPTIGFFCREINGQKRSAMFKTAVTLARRHSKFDVLCIGENLDHLGVLGRYEVRAAGIADYARISALAVTSVSSMVPLSAYEACAAGRTVISTPRNWPGSGWPMVRTGENAAQLAALIVKSVRERATHKPHSPYLRSDWAAHQVQLAERLIPKKDEHDFQH